MQIKKTNDLEQKVEQKTKKNNTEMYARGVAGSFLVFLDGIYSDSRLMKYAGAISGVGFSGALVYECRDNLKIQCEKFYNHCKNYYDNIVMKPNENTEIQNRID